MSVLSISNFMTFPYVRTTSFLFRHTRLPHKLKITKSACGVYSLHLGIQRHVLFLNLLRIVFHCLTNAFLKSLQCLRWIQTLVYSVPVITIVWLICAFVVRKQQKQVFSWRGPFSIKMPRSTSAVYGIARNFPLMQTKTYIAVCILHLKKKRTTNIGKRRKAT